MTLTGQEIKLGEPGDVICPITGTVKKLKQPSGQQSRREEEDDFDCSIRRSYTKEWEVRIIPQQANSRF